MVMARRGRNIFYLCVRNVPVERSLILNLFDWDTAFDRLADLPRQAEWEEYMSVFQQADPNASSAEKWQLMERMFHLYE